MIFGIDPLYFLIIAPGVLLGMWAQWRVKSTYAEASQEPASMSGAAAARRILDDAGLHNVDIELVDGFLSDHYDPQHKVLRLSPDVYQGRSAAAVGIAAHEAGHAIQDGERYTPLVLRNLIVPTANFGGSISVFLIIAGALMHSGWLIYAGIGLFSTVAVFQLVNLPVEFDASHRAKVQLQMLGLAGQQEMVQVERVLSAAAWTYVAATLTTLLTLLYYLIRFGGVGSRDE